LYVLAARGLVVKHVGAVELRVSMSPQYSPSPTMPFSPHSTSQNLVPIWLPHWPACICEVSRAEAAWRRGASVRKRAGGAKQHKKFCVALWHGKLKMPVARARVSRTRE
jgi:hypothetical protein